MVYVGRALMKKIRGKEEGGLTVKNSKINMRFIFVIL